MGRSQAEQELLATTVVNLMQGMGLHGKKKIAVAVVLADEEGLVMTGSMEGKGAIQEFLRFALEAQEHMRTEARHAEYRVGSLSPTLKDGFRGDRKHAKTEPPKSES